MPDSKDVKRWFQYAQEDFDAACMILERHPRNACFDFQQSAEKYLQAVLIAQELEPSRTHDLVVLLLEIDSTQQSNTKEVSAAQLLSFVGSRVRYPDRFDDVIQEEAEALREAAIVLQQFAFSKLKDLNFTF